MIEITKRIDWKDKLASWIEVFEVQNLTQIHSSHAIFYLILSNKIPHFKIFIDNLKTTSYLSYQNIHNTSWPLTFLKTQDFCFTSSAISLLHLLIFLSPYFDLFHDCSICLFGEFHHPVSKLCLNNFRILCYKYDTIIILVPYLHFIAIFLFITALNTFSSIPQPIFLLIH